MVEQAALIQENEQLPSPEADRIEEAYRVHWLSFSDLSETDQIVKISLLVLIVLLLLSCFVCLGMWLYARYKPPDILEDEVENRSLLELIRRRRSMSRRG